MIEGDDKNVQPILVQNRSIIRDVFGDGEYQLRTKCALISSSPVDNCTNVIKPLYKSNLWKPRTDRDFERYTYNPQHSSREFVRIIDGQQHHSPIPSASNAFAIRRGRFSPLGVANRQNKTVVRKPKTLLEELLTKKYGSFYQELLAFQHILNGQREKIDWFNTLSQTSGAGESRLSAQSVQPITTTPRSSSRSNESVHTSEQSAGISSHVGTNPSRNRLKCRVAKVTPRNRTRRRTRTAESRYSNREIYSLDSKLAANPIRRSPAPPHVHPKLKTHQELPATKRRSYSSGLSRSLASIKSMKRKRPKLSCSTLVPRGGANEDSINATSATKHAVRRF